jgi:hypothetical protein
MLLINQLLHTLFVMVNDFFMVLSEADTPEAWGECPIAVSETHRR